ncbi:acetyl-CoA C-acyltransferase [Flexibacterium corallicola]|uniref:acetyl-CoA C-acyltransferase n=1 Tax=Flexibacterium corallicola TaxID=3037259 RepID=UPI00286ED440|nr:acetyl-CoA C-acyltransferase [Pseudovibrio sp. M1P-2-3]
MREAVFVSTARTPIGKAFRGAFNATPGPTLVAESAKAAVERSGVEHDMIEDFYLGCAFPEGATSRNVARLAAIRAGLPVTTGGVTITRFCASGIQAISMAANAIVQDGVPCVLAGGAESISLNHNIKHIQDPWLAEHKPAVYMPMIETADIVAKRYNVSREAQDEYALQSQMRTAKAQKADLFADEIISVSTVKKVKDKETEEVSDVAVTIERDECNRPTTTLEGLSKLEPVRGPEQFITAGNASQLSDGSAAVVMMEAKEAEKRGLNPLGAFRGFATAGCEPDEMGIGPVYAIPRLLERHGLKIDDIDIWELNEAFASQVLYCRDTLGIDNEKLNVNGGAISIGHPYGMTGARQAGHILLEGKRRGAKYGVVTMCIGSGQGAAGLIEIY